MCAVPCFLSSTQVQFIHAARKTQSHCLSGLYGLYNEKMQRNERILWNCYRGVTSQQTWKSFHVESKHRNHSASAMAKYLIQLDYEIYVTVAGSWRMTKSVTSYDKEAERPVLVVT